MLAGKWISKMFEPNYYKHNVIIDYDRLNYEFTSELFYEDLAKMIDNYFNKLAKNTTFICNSCGKVRWFYNHLVHNRTTV